MGREAGSQNFQVTRAFRVRIIGAEVPSLILAAKWYPSDGIASADFFAHFVTAERPRSASEEVLQCLPPSDTESGKNPARLSR
jgi:hypothetical protein